MEQNVEKELIGYWMKANYPFHREFFLAEAYKRAEHCDMMRWHVTDRRGAATIFYLKNNYRRDKRELYNYITGEIQ